MKPKVDWMSDSELILPMVDECENGLIELNA